ncbi:MAG TPA: serine hydrolase [Acidimicrobiales bacterium]|nr:serine hydrolase [Acidimicrobiales bacterium]
MSEVLGGGRRRALRVMLWVVIAAQTTVAAPLAVELATRGEAERAAVDWVLAGAQRRVSAGEVEERFSPRILAQVPAPDMAAMINALGPDGPFNVIDTLYDRDDELALVARGQSIPWRITIDLDRHRRIDHLLFEPHAPPHPRADTWSEFDAALRRIAPEVGLLAARVVEGRCEPVHAIAPDVALSLASGFKLYVLGAVAEAIAARRITWEQRVTIQRRQIVHSSSRYLDAAGETATVRDLARAMWDVSDNTATDVLIELVGREAVEAALTTMGMAEPARNIPLLLLREWSILKYGRPPLAPEYLQLAGVSPRRAFLSGRIAELGGRLGELDWSVKPAHAEIEWFATPNDQCRALLHLQAMAKRPGIRQIREVVQTTAGGKITYASYKGGSEAGVLSHALYFERGGERYVVVVLLRNRDVEIAMPPELIRDAAYLLHSGEKAGR